MISPCAKFDVASILAVINNGARAYKGVIPEDCWHDPYMSEAYLCIELDAGVRFWRWDESGRWIAVMGIQEVKDVTLIRHAYVLLEQQRRGIGSRLLSHLISLASGPLLVGTWKANAAGIGLYQKYGFRVLTDDESRVLLGKYWDITPRHAETSIVLAHASVDIQPLLQQ